MIHACRMPHAMAAVHPWSGLGIIQARNGQNIELLHLPNCSHKRNAMVSSHSHLAHVPSQANLQSMIEWPAKLLIVNSYRPTAVVEEGILLSWCAKPWASIQSNIESCQLPNHTSRHNAKWTSHCYCPAHGPSLASLLPALELHSMVIFYRSMPNEVAECHLCSWCTMTWASILPKSEFHHLYIHSHQHNVRVSSHHHLVCVLSQAKLLSMIKVPARVMHPERLISYP